MDRGFPRSLDSIYSIIGIAAGIARLWHVCCYRGTSTDMLICCVCVACVSMSVSTASNLIDMWIVMRNSKKFLKIFLDLLKV